MQPPNILITNYCNQNCPFCFARTEMKKTTIDREMSLKDFEDVLKKMKRNKIDTVKLLGGEPTLHSKFEEIIKMSLNYFSNVQVFTNGIISDDKASFLADYFPRVKLTVNIMTPGFLIQKNIRQLVIKRLNEFSRRTEVTLSLTIDTATDISLILKTITPHVIKQVTGIRIGFANPIAGEKNFLTFEQFPKIGKQLYLLIKAVKSVNPRIKLSLNCGFTRCMFTDKQYDYLARNDLIISGWGCFGKGSSMDIQTNLSAFHCFPLSKNQPSLKENSLNAVNRRLLKNRYTYWTETSLKECKKCLFYGHVPGKCPGPCIAFLINQSNS